MRRLALATVFAIVVACGGGTGDAPRVTATSSPVPERTRFGVAGVIPPNADHATAADFESLYRSYAGTGGLVGVYTNWADSTASEGRIPKLVDTMFAAGKRYGFTPLIGLGVARDVGSTIMPTVLWDDLGQRRRFIDTARVIAKTYRPAYLVLGVEVDRLARVNASSFEGFVSAYREAYEIVKAASPTTAVLTVFQLELIRGAGYLSTGTRSSSARWDLVDRFSGTLDAVGFTTYPFLDYESPAAMPADYYTSAASRFKLPVAFTEIGWPSAPLAAAPTSGHGGTPDEQVEFVKRFFELTAAVNAPMSLWSFPNDPGATAGPFAAVGLRERDGTPKPALAAWREAIAAR